MADYIKETTPKASKLANYNILEVVYKTVREQDIHLYVAVSKGAAPGKHPVIVKWHGGAWVTGTALYEDWFADWLVTYIHAHDAILVAPNYRLMPESSAAEMYADVADAWTWIRDSLQPLLASPPTAARIGPGILADRHRVLVVGESAGATLALMSGLTQPLGTIRACVAAYPGMADWESPAFHAGIGNTRPFGAPLLPAAVFHEHVARMVPGRIVTSVVPPGRTEILIAQNQWGLLKPYWGDDDRHFPLKLVERVRDGEAGQVPYMLLIHGTDDSVCDAGLTELFVAKAVRNLGPGRADAVLVPGEHGFDCDLPLETAWLKEALAKPTAIWLGEAES